MDSNSSGESPTLGRSALNSEDTAPPRRTMPPRSARARGPTTFPRPIFNAPGPDSVLNTSCALNDVAPVRSSGPVIA